MKIGIPKESEIQEKRVPIIPSIAEKLVKKGAEVHIESNMGISSGFSDSAYEKVGVKVSEKEEVFLSDIVIRLRKPMLQEVSLLKKGAVHISYLDPFHEKELLQKFADHEISSISMEMMPRSTRAQKMDSLSSQASIAGYEAVIIAAGKLNKIFPMMSTPAGTIQPSKVFIIGAGVAGLQAIATARRLGARVEAFDTRPVVEEQVQSLGAKFVKIDLGDTGQTKDGYAKALTEEQLAKQREVMAKHCAQADVVITTAQVFGKKAPLIVTKDMIAGMNPGSVVIDMAVETGGNVEGSQLDTEVLINGVNIIGFSNLSGLASVHASQMYGSNVAGFILEFWDDKNKTFVLKNDDEIIKATLITHQGKIVHEQFHS